MRKGLDVHGVADLDNEFSAGRSGERSDDRSLGRVAVGVRQPLLHETVDGMHHGLREADSLSELRIVHQDGGAARPTLSNELLNTPEAIWHGRRNRVGLVTVVEPSDNGAQIVQRATSTLSDELSLPLDETDTSFRVQLQSTRLHCEQRELVPKNIVRFTRDSGSFQEDHLTRSSSALRFRQFGTKPVAGHQLSPGAHCQTEDTGNHDEDDRIEKPAAAT